MYFRVVDESVTQYWKCHAVLCEKKSEHSKSTADSVIINEVATNVIDVWIEAGIPTNTLRSTEHKLEILHQELRNILKKKAESKSTAIEHLQSNGLNLFDIAS